MTIVKIQYMYEIIKNIKSGKFKITKDTVISLNDSVRFRDSNDIMSFKFNDYKKIVYVSKEEYKETNIGEEFYLVFVDGMKEILKIYPVKDNVLDNNVNAKLI